MNTTVGLALRGLAGAVVGGVVGYVVFMWLVHQRFYALVLPGAMVGVGCAFAMQKSSNIAGILCGLAGVPLGIFCEWRAFPFVKDSSFAYFVAHLHELRPMTWIMIVLGALFGYWLGKGRDQFVSRHPDAS